MTMLDFSDLIKIPEPLRFTGWQRCETMLDSGFQGWVIAYDVCPPPETAVKCKVFISDGDMHRPVKELGDLVVFNIQCAVASVLDVIKNRNAAQT
jgi:hypothetical protein